MRDGSLDALSVQLEIAPKLRALAVGFRAFSPDRDCLTPIELKDCASMVAGHPECATLHYVSVGFRSHTMVDVIEDYSVQGSGSPKGVSHKRGWDLCIS